MQSYWAEFYPNKGSTGVWILLDSSQYHVKPSIVKVLPKGGRLLAKGTTKIGRSAIDGRFIPVKEALKHKPTTVVETIKKKK